MTKKKHSLWFEETKSRKTNDSPFEDIGKMFKPVTQSRIIKFPEFRTDSIPVRIAETNDEILLRASLPEFSKNEIRLKVTPRLAYISAEKKNVKVDRGENFLIHASSSSSANRILELPASVDTESVKARYRDGVLEVVMKKKMKKEKRVRVE